MKIRHILVGHEYEAKDLLRKLSEGSEFEALAKKFSKCSSAALGGNLGDLTHQLHRLDPDFRAKAEIMKIGEISDPVRTRFGYHLIQRY